MFSGSKKTFNYAAKTGVSFFSTAVKYAIKNVSQFNKINPSEMGSLITKIIVTPAKDAQKMIIEKSFDGVYLHELGNLHREFWDELIQVQNIFPKSYISGHVEDSISIMTYEIVKVVGDNIVDNT